MKSVKENLKIIARPAFRTCTGNPYNYLLYTHMWKNGVVVEEFTILKVLFGKYQIFHIHWPEFFLTDKFLLRGISKSIGMLLLIDWMKSRGTKVVWTVHNIVSHENYYPRVESIFWRIFIKKVDAAINLTAVSDALLLVKFPDLINRPRRVIPHGHYKEIYENTYTQTESRKSLGVPLDAKVFLFFGAIRSYKNVPALIDSFNDLDYKDSYLIIAGGTNDKRIMADILERRKGNGHIILRIEHIPQNEVQVFFNASDLVVLPFSEVLNSGSALLALSFNKPILVPDVPTMSDLQSKVGTNFVHLYQGKLDSIILSGAMNSALCNKEQKVNLDDFDWDLISEETVELYQHFGK